MSRVASCLLLVAGLLWSTPRHAAPQDIVPPGAPVRVTAPSAGLVNLRGRLDSVTTDVIQVDGLIIARDAITKVEVLRDVSNFLRYTGLGLLTGVALGVAVCLNECPSGDSDVTKGGFMLLYGASAGAGGLVLGSIVGGLTHRTEWHRVPESSLRPIVTPSSDGRVRVGLRIRT